MLRLGSRSVRSEAEFEEISNNLKELEASEKHMQSLAVGPPQLLSTYERRMRYVNTNGLIKNVETFELDRKAAIIWSEDEKRIFREKFAHFPKDFERIASSLELKSCADCVLFYYQNKKKESFKSSKAKKKKTKAPAPRVGSMKTDPNKQKQQQSSSSTSNKPDLFNFEVEEYPYIDDEEDEDYELDSQEEPFSITDTEDSKGHPLQQQDQSLDLIDETKQQQQSENDESKTTAENTNTKLDNKPPTKGARATLQPTKVINTRSSKFKANNSNNNAVQQQPQQQEPEVQEPPPKLVPSLESETISTTEECIPTSMITLPTPSSPVNTAASSSENSNPPLRMTIIVTSPSHVTENTPAVSVASIVKETVTAAASSYTPEPSIAQSKDDVMPPTDVEPSTEDLIRQHLSKMPGDLIDICFVLSKLFFDSFTFFLRFFVLNNTPSQSNKKKSKTINKTNTYVVSAAV